MYALTWRCEGYDWLDMWLGLGDMTCWQTVVCCLSWSDHLGFPEGYLLNPENYCMYHELLTFTNSVFCPHNVCVLRGSQNKQRLFPYTALTDWFL